MTIVPLWAKIAVVLAAIALLLFGIHRLDLSRQAIGYTKAVAEYSVKLIGAQNDARAQEIAWQKQLKLEQEKTNELLNAKESRYVNVSAANARLRDTIKHLSDSMSATSIAARDARIKALSSVFAECTNRLAEMGRAAEASESIQ